MATIYIYFIFYTVIVHCEVVILEELETVSGSLAAN